MEEAVKQYTVEEVKQLLFEQEVPGDDARILLAIAYLESKFTHGIDGDADPNDKGLWQINPPQYFDNGKPDNMTKAFFQEQGETLEIDEFTEKVKYDIDYATKFAVHIYRYRRDNPKSYGKDPFDAWTTYKEYIKPNMKRLAPTDELVFKDGLDAEITQAVDYIKGYNQIAFGKQEKEVEEVEEPVQDTPETTTTTTQPEPPVEPKEELTTPNRMFPTREQYYQMNPQEQSRVDMLPDGVLDRVMKLFQKITDAKRQALIPGISPEIQEGMRKNNIIEEKKRNLGKEFPMSNEVTQ